MHEAAVAKSILDIVALRAAEHEGALVRVVKVDLGQFTAVDPESLEFAFDAIKQDYADCKESKLELRLVQTRALCASNRHHYMPAASFGFCCTTCGDGIGELTAGTELQVTGCVLELPHGGDENARIAG